MGKKNIFGLILLSAAFAIAPFGYWLSFKWYLVALAVAVPGAMLYFTDRTAKKLNKQEEVGASDVYPTKELKGFKGSEIFDDHDD